MKVRASGVYGVEIRHRGLAGGRLDISLEVRQGATPGASAAENKREAKRREAAVHLMVERAEWQILRDLRAGAFGAADLANAVRDGTVDNLRRTGEHTLTLGKMVDRVMTEKRATQEPNTVRHYDKVTRSLLEEWGEDVDLTEVTTDDAREWLYRKRGDAPWSANTQASYHMVAAYVWRSAIDLELETSERIKARPRITRNIWDHVEPRGERTRRHAFLEPPEWNDLLRVVRGRPQAALFALMCLAGLRIQEALQLRTGIDVDMADGVIRIQPREGERAWKPKTDHSVREVPITDALRPVLEHHAEKFAGARYFIRSGRSDRPLSYTQARQQVEEWFKAAGLSYGREGEGLTAHSLRHTFASWLVREGWSSALVAKLMGNTSREVERTYMHLQRTDLHRVMATIDALVSEQSLPSNRPVPIAHP